MESSNRAKIVNKDSRSADVLWNEWVMDEITVNKPGI
jgi:hypothetical protein